MWIVISSEGFIVHRDFGSYQEIFLLLPLLRVDLLRVLANQYSPADPKSILFWEQSGVSAQIDSDDAILSFGQIHLPNAFEPFHRHFLSQDLAQQLLELVVVLRNLVGKVHFEVLACRKHSDILHLLDNGVGLDQLLNLL